MTEQKTRIKQEFVCMDEECMKSEGSPCIITVWGDENTDYPSYCPWEFEPSEHKYKPWKKIKG